MESVRNDFSLGGALSSATTGDLGGFIESVFGQSPGRKRQIFIRNLAASVNGYPSYEAFQEAGEPWYRETIIDFRTQAGEPYTQDELAMYPSKNSGYKGINYTLGTNLDQFKEGEIDGYHVDDPLRGEPPYTLQAGSTPWATIIIVVVVIAAVIYFAAGKGKK